METRYWTSSDGQAPRPSVYGCNRRSQYTSSPDSSDKSTAGTKRPGDDQPETPNGDFRAWACVVGCLLLQVGSFECLNACGIFQLSY
ncbi:hypothetical protein VTN02DRAFT_2855 [Thermoascus thermophilus]